MELEKLQNNLEKEETKTEREQKMGKFINQLEEFINNNPIRNNNIEKNEGICVVKDRNNEKLTLVDISNGDEFDIFITKSSKNFEKINNEMVERIYETSEDSFYNIDLGTNVILKDKNCEIYEKDINITNKTVINKLEELYFNLNEEEENKYIVYKIEDDKIYLKGDEGGYFSVYKQSYPEFKENDRVIRKNKRYENISYNSFEH